MSDKTPATHRDRNLDLNDPDVRPADQAEGERDNKTSVTVKHTPDQAEGERETVEKDIRSKERQGKL